MGDLIVKSKIKVNFTQLKEFEKRIEKLSEKNIDDFYNALIRNLAGRLLEKVKDLTPVFERPEFDRVSQGSGTLRDRWTIGNIEKSGDEYSVQILNPVPYATYVEKGHRGVAIYIKAPAGGGSDIGWRVMHTDTHWTEGVFMLEKAETELSLVLQEIVDKRLAEFLSAL